MPGDLLLFLTTGICLENYIGIRAFRQSPVSIDQKFCTRCMLCLLQSWWLQLTALPG